jgi:hypothetical protein
MKVLTFSRNVAVHIKHFEFGTELKCNPGKAGHLVELLPMSAQRILKHRFQLFLGSNHSCLDLFAGFGPSSSDVNCQINRPNC